MNVTTLSASTATAGHKQTRGTFNSSIDAERIQAGNVQAFRGRQRHAARRVANHLMEISAQEELQKFVENNILSLDCTKYIPSNSHDITCCCGYSKQWHVKQKIDVDGQVQRESSRCNGGIIIVSNPRNNDDIAAATKAWDESRDIRNSRKRCYGVINFSGFGEDGSRYPAPYVRISTRKSCKPALTLLTEYWLLRRPKLIISVLGSDEKFFKRAKEKKIFQKELVDMIQNSGGFSKTAPGQENELSQGAWVITNGFGSGATQCVAEAINEYAARVSLVERLNIAIIGVCHWGSLDGTDMLTPPSESGGLFPATYDKRELLNEAIRKEKSVKILDCNHTHFILYDNGKGRDDDPRTWRDEFEDFIASKLMVIQRDEGVEWLKYPVVRLLVNGETKEIENAKRLYRSLPRFTIPLLILKESGIDENSRKKESKGIISVRRSPKRDSAESPITTSSFECDSNVIEIKEHIRNALLSSNPESTAQELQGLIAAGLISHASEASAVHISIQTIRSGNRLNEFLMYSLINKQHEIVELILNSGADLEEFLTITTIKNLYLQIMDNTDEDLQSTFLRHLVRKDKLFKEMDEWKKLKAVGCLLSELMGHDHSNNYTAPWIENVSSEDERDKQGVWEKRKLDSPQKHLMLWAILFNLDKMALLFWRTGKSHIGCALLAANLSKNLAKKAHEMEMDDFFQSYTNLANTFETRATNVLHNCYLQNTRLTEFCLIRSIDDLGHSTALNLAHGAELMDFMDHVSYQQQLDSIWLGGMAPKTSLLKLAFTALFPFTNVFFLNFVTHIYPGHNGESGQLSHTAVSSSTKSATRVAPEAVVDSESIETSRSGKTKGCCGLSLVVGKPYLKIQYKTALRIFFSAPATKFIYSTMSYITFLVMFSVFILHEFAEWTGAAGSRFEIVVWIWAATLLAELLLQQRVEENKAAKGTSTTRLRVKQWLKNPWHTLDILVYMLLIASIAVRSQREVIGYGRMTYAACGSLLVIRSMRAFRVSEDLGPKLIILQKMALDVILIIGILAVFLISFGISYRALAYPEAHFNLALLENILYNPYFIIFGQVPIDEIIRGKVSSCNTTIQSSMFGEEDACPQKTWLADVYLALYCFIANILVINLLIAMFNFTFRNVHTNSTRHWKYQRFSLIHEFYRRPVLPAPLSLPWCIVKLLASIGCRCTRKDKTLRLRKRSQDAFERVLTAEETRQVLALERRAMERVTGLLNESSLTTGQRFSDIQERFDEVLEEAKQMRSSLDSRNRQKNKKTQTDTQT